jgi:hypothetical protein
MRGRWELVDEAKAALLRAARPLTRATPLLTAVAVPLLGSAPLVACNPKGGLKFDTSADPCLSVDEQDLDGDGLSDDIEASGYGTSPFDRDSDDDGLLDGEEINLYSTDPMVTDTDGGGTSDGVEVRVDGTDANDAGDDLPDADDADADGVTDRGESNFGSDATLEDTDGDGLGDYDEIYVYGTDPADTDSDDDGASDPEEVNAGTDARDPCTEP